MSIKVEQMKNEYEQFNDQDKNSNAISEINYFPNDTTKHIDYVIYYKDANKDPEKWGHIQLVRKYFFKRLEDEGFSLHFLRARDSSKSVYVLLNCDTERLMDEAERMYLQFPLKDSYRIEKYESIFNSKYINKIFSLFQTPVIKSEANNVYAPFETDIKNIFKNFENDLNNSRGFPHSLRLLLVDQILKNLYFDESKLSDEDDLQVSLLKNVIRNQENEINETNNNAKQLLATMANRIQMKRLEEEITITSKVTSKAGLPYMLQERYFDDAFVLHDDTRNDQSEMEIMLYVVNQNSNKTKSNLKQTRMVEVASVAKPKIVVDKRSFLNKNWASFRNIFKTQPLYQIRNYFGEYVGLYFAWVGVLMTSLILPSVIGSVFFIAGLSMAIQQTSNKTYNESEFSLYNNVYTDSFVKSFNNVLTQGYAGIMCCWGLLFREYWKRESIRISYDWRTDNYAIVESDRPQYIKSLRKYNKKHGTTKIHYPRYLYLLKSLVSYIVLLSMICIICLEIVLIAIVRLHFVNVIFSDSSVLQFVFGYLGTTGLNTLLIIVMNKIYNAVSFKLNYWENPRTQTEFNDSLIMKRFIFEFVNSYGTLFYIIFFRNASFLKFNDGLFGLGNNYVDQCDGSQCMMLLTIQLTLVLVLKPFPRFINTAVWPLIKSRYVKHKYEKIKESTKKDGSSNNEDLFKDMNEKEKNCLLHVSVENAKKKFEITIHDEYIEKIVIYGYIMIFASTFFLAPLLFFIILLIDVRIDAKRLLWMLRRPIPYKAQDIGLFLYIIDFINLCAVITNAFIIGFTSDLALTDDKIDQFEFVITFEHVIILCFLVIYWLPSSSTSINFNKKQEAICVRDAVVTARTIVSNKQKKPANSVKSKEIKKSRIVVEEAPSENQPTNLLRQLFFKMNVDNIQNENANNHESSKNDSKIDSSNSGGEIIKPTPKNKVHPN